MSEAHSISLRLNGSTRDIRVSTNTTLLEALRWALDLTGTKKCCAVGECGACTVLLDGRAVNSCLVLAVEVNGSDITTIEGLEDLGQLSDLQDAFLREGAVQCGFCIPGMVMSAHYLLMDDGYPTLDDVREGLAGNLCRCGGYNRIVKAVLATAEGRTS